ncbi:N-formylglutamate amidohydrolase [Sphingobium subterraneum]|uniref:Putative N-formylglutamate amidohydrolase n=1 Tax=Sphingobium subterraneum TaxID=627688 RepID=A0A841IZW6_9SPHN|nr:N-formylglutamate amidohydrolase [Sphingobium subterraneum]MBB6123652.1 putative N-formylglutamate amidohydrolase [Sphingobium subterraneum]
MSEVFTFLKGGDAPLLIVADHASRHVPADIDLGIAPHLLDDHIACDIGVAEVAGLLVEDLQCSAMLCGVSRLVIDCNRDEHAPGLIPHISDGHVIPGNEHVDHETRLARFYRPYHAALEARIAGMGQPFILSLHSFTPALAARPEERRPWEIGILYNDDDRGARVAIPLLEEEGWVVGDQLPYSGRLLNYTMNRHVEANGIPYLGVEMRQDISGTAEGQRRFARVLARVVEQCRAALA